MQASNLQTAILSRLLDERVSGSTFQGLYDALSGLTTIQAFGRSVAACERRGWITDEPTENGDRTLSITPPGEIAFGGGVLSPMVNREAWKRVRGPLIGSSDVAAILGIHEYGKGPWDVWDRIVLGQWNDPPKVGGDIRRGNRQEQNAMDRFQEVYGLEQISRDMVHHPTYPYLVSDVDSVILPTDQWPEELRANPLWETVISMSETGSEGAHEVKCPRSSIYFDCKDSGLRTEYAVQMQMHLLCGGFDFGVFTLYDAQYDDIQSFPVTRHEDFLDHLREGLPKWYETYVVGRTRPVHPDAPPSKWPTKVEGKATEITDGKTRDQVEFLKLRFHERVEAEQAYTQTEAALLALLPEVGQKFAGDGVVIERTSSPRRRQWNRGAFAAELKLAQEAGDSAALQSIDPDAERFYYLTGGKEKTEVKVFAKPEQGP